MKGNCKDNKLTF